MVVGSWATSLSFGWKDFVLKENLKALKGKQKNWNHLVFGNLDYQIKSLREVVTALT